MATSAATGYQTRHNRLHVQFNTHNDWLRMSLVNGACHSDCSQTHRVLKTSTANQRNVFHKNVFIYINSLSQFHWVKIKHFFAFMGPCIADIFPCITSKTLRYTIYLFIYFCEMFYMFQAVPPPIIRGSKTVYTASGICQTFTAACRYRGRVLFHDSGRQLLMMGGSTAWNM
jgi:hypothetical protein